MASPPFATLLRDLPDIARFRAAIDADRVRKYGQKNHDRYVLEYLDGMDLPAPWQEFIDELRGADYRALIGRLLGHRNFRFRFHWHYTPRACTVSPHCESRTKLASHIFYLNTRTDWDPAWGGETVVLDDHGRFAEDSSPAFEDFDAAWAAETMDNRSLIFGRRGNSWHGVRAIDCPEGNQFLEHLQRHIGGLLTIIWDGLPVHRSRLVREFVAAQSGAFNWNFCRRMRPNSIRWNTSGATANNTNCPISARKTLLN